MNSLRDYYERALQEFGTTDDGEWRLNPLKGAGLKSKSNVSQKNLFTISCYSSMKDKIPCFHLTKLHQKRLNNKSSDDSKIRYKYSSVPNT